jgi:hypothetical protein
MQDDNNNSNNNNRKSKYAIYTLIIVVVLLLILILFLYLIRSPLIFRSGASTLTQTVTQGVPEVASLANSYIFASPLRAKIGGEKIRVTVYILDDRGLGVIGREVTIGGGNSLTVTSIQSNTDAQGRAVFDIASQNSPGTYMIQATSDGTALPQKATISFD